MDKDPTLLGTVEDVNGATISVRLHKTCASGLTFINGIGYRIGQLGSFVKIPLGFIELYGIVSQVGSSSIPETLKVSELIDDRWMTVQLIGEGTKYKGFERGLSIYPTVRDNVHLVTEKDLRFIYGRPESPSFINIGSVAGSDSIPALLDINTLVTRHSAVVGSTGSGKSTTVAGILNSVAVKSGFKSARILVLDIHGEYSSALSDHATVFKLNPNTEKGEKPLFIPYWALTFDELLELSFGNIKDTERGAIIELISERKQAALNFNPRKGVSENNLNVDTPVPFSIHQLWLDLHKLVISTHLQTGNQSLSTVAFEVDDAGTPIDTGDAMKVRPPKCLPQNNSREANPKVYLSQNPLNIRRSLEGLAFKLRDTRYDFLFKPGKWLPNEKGVPENDLDDLLSGWLECNNPITTLDLSGIPRDILNTLIGALLRIVYDALFWSRNLSEGGRERPLLIVLEEAHAYLKKEDNGPANSAVQRIVKEGRKYGVGAMIISQRPVELDSTILSQCGTFITMRLANSNDRTQVTSTAPDNLEGLFSMLPVLRTGEAIIVGESVKIPLRAYITPPPKNRRPDSQDPIVFDDFGPGGWNRNREDSSYSEVVELWRNQTTQSTKVKDFEKGGKK